MYYNNPLTMPQENTTPKEMKLQLKHLAPYLPYGLKIKILNYKCDYVGIDQSEANGYYMIGDEFFVTYQGGSTGKSINDFKPILRPISDVDKPIDYGLQTYAATELFEIGDDGGYNYEFTNGNVKLIQQLKTIAKYNVYHDFNFMPYAVGQELFERHFDVFGLIPAGLAIDINTLNQ